MRLLSIALKNVLRAKRRAFMTISVLSLGIVLYILLSSFADGFVNMSIDSLREEDYSDIRIRIANFDTDIPLNEDNLWLDQSTNLDTGEILLDTVEGITYTPRLIIYAEVDNYVDSIPVALIGIDEARDSKVLLVKNTSDEPLGDLAWLGAGLANDLDVEVGDYVNLTFRTKGDAFVSAEYEIGGLLNSSNPMYSEGGVVINLAELQEMFDLDYIYHYTIKLDDESKLDEVADELQTLYKDQEVLTWKDLTSDLVGAMDARMSAMTIFYVIIGIITFLGLTNSILISVWEKKKNTGTLRALGFMDSEIVKIFIYEGFWIGVFGVTIGVILAIIGNIPLSTIGIDYSTALDSASDKGTDIGLYIPPVVRSAWDIKYFLLPIIVVPIASMLVSYIPARKSVRMSIVDCIRNNT